MLQLFYKLCGIPTYWEHFEPHNQNFIHKLLPEFRENRDDYVFLQSRRDPLLLRESYIKRAKGDKDREASHLEQLAGSIHVRDELERIGYPNDFVIDLNATNSLKTRDALKVIEACGAFPNDEACAFMQHWKPLNALNAKAHRGFGSKEAWVEFRPTLNERRFKRLKEEKDSGTRN